MERTTTTVIGILAIVMGVLGAGFVATAWITGGFPTDRGGLLIVACCLSFAAKAALIALGFLLLGRSRFALSLLICILVMSTVHTVLMQGWFVEPLPPGLSNAARAGRATGHFIALIVPLVMYVMLLAYLLLPKSRLEFVRESHKPQSPTPQSFTQ